MMSSDCLEMMSAADFRMKAIPNYYCFRHDKCFINTSEAASKIRREICMKSNSA